ncbi:hypothetical protein ABEF93_006355 [Exophiala dermatitidis]
MPHSVHPTPRAGTPDAEGLSTRYWNRNIPKQQWTEECPEYLVGIGDKNMRIISSREEDCHKLSWPEVQELVKTGRIDQFQRSPSQLRAYLKWVYHLKQQYGSVSAYIQHELLRWDDITPSGDPPFQNPEDYKILYNDWPYYIDEDIKHLVVWTKFVIDEDEPTGQVSEKARVDIETFIARTFILDAGQGSEAETSRKIGMPRDHIVWFKNWKSLKSVHALEHFHVMLYKPPADLLVRVTGEDRSS